MTEDADVGIRLARFGYSTAVIDLPTLEEAPLRVRTWFRQRTRWFKGWLQTWLVHTRQPLRLYREVGFVGALGFTLTSAGIIISAMAYPVYLAAVLLALLDPLDLWARGGAFHAAVLGVHLFNLAAGHLAMVMLLMRALAKRGRLHLAPCIVLLPLYWLLMSAAAYGAALDLIVRPHHWAKTPHRRHRRREAADGAPARTARQSASAAPPLAVSGR